MTTLGCVARTYTSDFDFTVTLSNHYYRKVAGFWVCEHCGGNP